MSKAATWVDSRLRSGIRKASKYRLQRSMEKILRSDSRKENHKPRVRQAGFETSGTGEECRNKKMTGTTSAIEHVSYEKAYGTGFEDMRRRCPNIEKIRKLIKFEPK